MLALLSPQIYTERVHFIGIDQLEVQVALPDTKLWRYFILCRSERQEVGKDMQSRAAFSRGGTGVRRMHSLAGSSSLGTTFKGKYLRETFLKLDAVMEQATPVNWNQTKFCCYDCRSSIYL